MPDDEPSPISERYHRAIDRWEKIRPWSVDQPITKWLTWILIYATVAVLAVVMWKFLTTMAADWAVSVGTLTISVAIALATRSLAIHSRRLAEVNEQLLELRKQKSGAGQID